MIKKFQKGTVVNRKKKPGLRVKSKGFQVSPSGEWDVPLEAGYELLDYHYAHFYF